MAYAQKGCCSWHGGVSFCDANVGRLICRDGSYSPSCRCKKSLEENNNKKRLDYLYIPNLGK